MTEQESGTSSSLRPVFEKFVKNKDVSLVYGEPIYVENKWFCYRKLITKKIQLQIR